MNIRKAERKQAKIKMGLQGPSGSGKTMGALLIAKGLVGNWEKVVLIDSEYHSGSLYAQLGNYNVLSLEEPFSPEKYIEAIDTCEKAGMEGIIIDSVSHEWENLLEAHGKMLGNSFSNWSKITPRHNAFVNRILQAKVHIIATIRSKVDYALNQKANGKYEVEKMGLKGITREGLDYELTLVLDIDINHNAKCTKDRTGLFARRPESIITENTGKLIAEWCMQGKTVEDTIEDTAEETVEEVKAKIRAAQSIEDLKYIYNTYSHFHEQILGDLSSRKKSINDQKPIIHNSQISNNGSSTDNRQ